MAGLGLNAALAAWAPMIELGNGGAAAVLDQPLAAAGGTLQITDVRVVSAPASPTQPLWIALAYEHGRIGTIIQAAWTVEGRSFRSLRIILARGGGEHMIMSAPPPRGWPLGEHRIMLSSSGAAAKEVVFRVS